MPAYSFCNKLAPYVPSEIPVNLKFCHFSLFSILSLTPFINKPDFVKNLSTSMIFSISLFEIINVIMNFYEFLRMLLLILVVPEHVKVMNCLDLQ